MKETSRSHHNFLSTLCDVKEDCKGNVYPGSSSKTEQRTHPTAAAFAGGVNLAWV